MIILEKYHLTYIRIYAIINLAIANKVRNYICTKKDQEIVQDSQSFCFAIFSSSL